MRDDAYIQLWKLLLTNDAYAELSIEAVVCYCILADRYRLSEITGYCDNNGVIYITYSQESLGVLLRCKRKKVAKVLCELENCGLIHRKHQGLNRADAIYVNPLSMCQLGTPECAGEEHADVSTPDINNNENNKTIIYNTDLDDLRAELMRVWDYYYIANQGDDIADIAVHIIDVAARIMCTSGDTIYIAGDTRDVDQVQSTIMRLTGVHIVFISRRILERYRDMCILFLTHKRQCVH